MLFNENFNNSFKSVFESLEDRVLFDGVPDATFVLPQGDAEQPVPAQVQDAQPADISGPRELILVDPGVADSDQLLAEVLELSSDSMFEIRFLDSDSDGVDQISELLSSAEGQYSAIHIISHGNEGEVQLGNSTLSNLNLNQYKEQLADWASALTADGDLLFYGCDLAGNAEGEQFIESISLLTGADVAASDDLTGAAELGGDWDLELNVGVVQTQALVATSFAGILVDTDGDGVDDVDDIDDDNDGITDAVERGALVNTEGLGEPDAIIYTDAGAVAFSIGGNTNGLGFRESGFEAAILNAGGTIIAETDFTSTTFANGTASITSDAVNSTPLIEPSTNPAFVSGDTGSGFGIFPGNAGDEPDGTIAVTTTLDFTTPVFAFGFDIVDLFDHANVGTFDDVYDVLIDGEVIYSLVGQSVGASNTGTVSIQDSNGIERGTLTVGQNIESFFGFVSPEPLSQLQFRLSTSETGVVGGGEDFHGFDSFRYVTSPLQVDSDGDGLLDQVDLDSDNDGITDNVEAQTTADYIAPSAIGASPEFIDTNNDGLDDRFDSGIIAGGTHTGMGLTPVNTDAGLVEGDLRPDFVDVDSDGDGLTDAVEAGHGVSQAAIDASADTDGDGLRDVVEGAAVNDGFDVNDENLDPTDTNFLLADSDNDVPADGTGAVPLISDLDFRDNVEAITATVTIAGPGSVVEGQTTTAYTVSLDETVPTGNSVEVALTYTGVATDGTDFTGVTTVTIPAGANNTTFTIATIDDPIAEGAESFVVTITGITDTDDSFDMVAIGTANNVTTTINDEATPGPEDTATVSISGPSTVIEGETATYTVAVDSAPVTNLDVDVVTGFVTTEAGDLTPVTTTVTIMAGQTSTTFDVDTLDDNLADNGETYTASIANPSGGGFENLVLGTNSVTTTINDQTGTDSPAGPEDTATVSISGPATVVEGETATYTVTVDSAPATNLNVDVVTGFVTTEAGDLTPVTTTVTIMAGQTSTTFDAVSYTHLTLPTNREV